MIKKLLHCMKLKFIEREGYQGKMSTIKITKYN
jgi:hypothetical protein